MTCSSYGFFVWSNRKVAPYFYAQKSEKFNFGYIPVRKVNNFFGQTADFSLLGSRKGKVYKTFKISGKTTYQLSFRNWKRSDIKIFAENRKNVLFGYIADRKIKNFYEKGENHLFRLHRDQKEKFLKKIPFKSQLADQRIVKK